MDSTNTHVERPRHEEMVLVLMQLANLSNSSNETVVKTVGSYLYKYIFERLDANHYIDFANHLLVHLGFIKAENYEDTILVNKSAALDALMKALMCNYIPEYVGNIINFVVISRRN